MQSLQQIDTSRDYTDAVRPHIEVVDGEVILDDEEHDERGVCAHLGRTRFPSIEAFNAYLTWLIADLKRLTAAPAE